MKKSDLARDVARRNRVEPGDAADQLDRAVNQIVRALRRGESAHLPGLGTLKPGRHWVFRPDDALEATVKPEVESNEH